MQQTFNNTNNNISTPIFGEIFRKAIHYSSAAIPIGYLFINKSIVLIIISALLFLMILVEFIKYKSDFIYNMYLKYFKHMLRDYEYDRTKFRINGASWVLLSAVFCIIIFPKLIAITGLLMLSFADSTAGLIGRMFGKKYFAPNRSYIGTAAFFLVGIIIILFAPKYFYSFKEYIIVFIAVIATTIADGLNLPIDDNFLIPVTCCSVMYFLYILIYSNFNLFI
jgi:dolichol kinase